MVEFVVCDDNEITRKTVQEIINKLMINHTTEHRTILYADYNTKFMKSIKDNEFNRIYILDIEVPSRSGIDIARIIRQYDKSSIIIFLTSHNELGNEVIKHRLNCLTFISKYDGYEENLANSIKEALKYIGIKKILEFTDCGIRITVPTNKILYVTRDTYERKCIVKTDLNEYKTYLTINELKEMLGNDFIQTHRSCLANKDRIREISISKSKIVFDNGTKIDLISDMYKKEIKNYKTRSRSK